MVRVGSGNVLVALMISIKSRVGSNLTELQRKLLQTVVIHAPKPKKPGIRGRISLWFEVREKCEKVMDHHCVLASHDVRLTRSRESHNNASTHQSSLTTRPCLGFIRRIVSRRTTKGLLSTNLLSLLWCVLIDLTSIEIWQDLREGSSRTSKKHFS